MKKSNLLTVFTFLISLSVLFASCQVVGGIFKAGVWVGIIGIVVVVALILWLVGKARK